MGLCWQVMASLSELAIPHLTSASIFAVTKAGSESLFRHNVKLLCVRPPPRLLCICAMTTLRMRRKVFERMHLSKFAMNATASSSCVMHMSLHVQAFAVCYGVTAGLRGYLFSLINADLIQVCFSCKLCVSSRLCLSTCHLGTAVVHMHLCLRYLPDMKTVHVSLIMQACLS